MNTTQSRHALASVFGTGVVAAIAAISNPAAVQAQGARALEEIVVTAQRREQSLQEVPLSIETFSGSEIRSQGFRNMDDLANFSPTVLINPNHLRASITVRGFGASTADAQTIEQSAPTFVDGIHFGRTHMVKLAFLDVERVEVLMGPQPVYFGQNVISGAFNITSRKPTPTWEADLNTEVGNFGKINVEAAAGGPLTETLGIRLAGKYDRSTGFLTDIISRARFPVYDNQGGRAILRWSPNDSFQATAKFEKTYQNKGAEGTALCLRGDGTLGALTGSATGAVAGQPVFEDSLLVDPPQGQGWDVDHLPLDTDCKRTTTGRAGNPPWPAPPATILHDTRSIILDIRDYADELFLDLYGYRAMEGMEKIESENSYLDLSYRFSNGITVNSLTGYSDYHRASNRENRNTAVFSNGQFRLDFFDSLSQELRVASPAGGTFEWMLGVYYQDTNQHGTQDSLRPNTITGRRLNVYEEDATWQSLFGVVTLNFMDNRASLDVGGRLTDYDKVGYQEGWVANWIIDDGTADGFSFPFNTRVANLNHPLNAGRVIGVTPLVSNHLTGVAQHGGPHDDIIYPKARDSGTEFDPQVTLRYRHDTNLSMYARFAQSFKAGGMNTSVSVVPPADSGFSYKPEYATTFEVGGKGSFWDGRGRYSLSAFHTEVKDLQIASAQNTIDGAGSLLFQNAAKQKAKGMELTVDTAVTEAWSLGVSGALLDNVMDEFIAPCTEDEVVNQAPGCDLDTELIDRSGQRAPNAPPWKVVVSSSYAMPVLERYLVSLTAKGYLSSWILTNSTSFSRVTTMDTHGDLNLKLSFGDLDGSWKVSAYTRNILEPRETYHPELDFEPPGLVSVGLYDNDFMTYGIQFEYSYR